MLRCKTTGNPCGTDTLGNGTTCPCEACQSRLKEEQRRSFVYGNTKLHNDNITRELVDEVAEQLKEKS